MGRHSYQLRNVIQYASLKGKSIHRWNYFEIINVGFDVKNQLGVGFFAFRQILGKNWNGVWQYIGYS
jgi:hypothetical protein